MTILDDIEFLEAPAHHPETGEYMGIEGRSRIHFDTGYLITKEAEARELTEVQRGLAQRRNKEKLRTMLLKTTFDIILAEQVDNVEPVIKSIYDYTIPVVVVKEIDRPVLIIPPKDFTRIHDAFDKLGEEARKKALEELAFGG